MQMYWRNDGLLTFALSGNNGVVGLFPCLGCVGLCLAPFYRFSKHRVGKVWRLVPVCYCYVVHLEGEKYVDL